MNWNENSLLPWFKERVKFEIPRRSLSSTRKAGEYSGWNLWYSWLVGWVLRHANSSGYFMPKTFLFVIFIWYNFYAYSYLNAINKYQQHQNKTIWWYSNQEKYSSLQCIENNKASYQKYRNNCFVFIINCIIYASIVRGRMIQKGQYKWKPSGTIIHSREQCQKYSFEDGGTSDSKSCKKEKKKKNDYVGWFLPAKKYILIPKHFYSVTFILKILK